MAIQTWQDAKQKGLTQQTLQELCDYDLALEDRIAKQLRIKYPQTSEKQISNWAHNAILRKMRREHWGFCPY